MSRPFDCRRGSSLIELLVVIALTSFVLSAMVVSLHAMFRADRQVRDELAFSATLARLSMQLRGDAHAAKTAAVQINAGKQSQLLLTISDYETIKYVASSGQIDRLKLHEEEIVHRDSFKFVEGASIDWSIGDHQSESMVRIEIVPTAKSELSAEGPNWPTIRIESAVGLDHTFDHSDSP